MGPIIFTAVLFGILTWIGVTVNKPSRRHDGEKTPYGDDKG